VDAGVFLGASTVSLVAGLRENTLALNRIIGVSPIHVFEYGVWRSEGFNKDINDIALIGGRIPKDGEPFTQLLESILNLHEDLLTYHWGDLMVTARDISSSLIEIAFFDLLKTYERDWFAFQSLGPRYIPGQTIVIHQDYFYEGAAWSVIRQEYLSEYFEFLGAIETSAFWLLRKEIPGDFFLSDLITTLETSALVEYLEAAAERTSDIRHKFCSQIRIVDFYLDRGLYSLAENKVNELSKSMPQALQIPRLSKMMVARQVRCLVRQ
jgi:hypothetical protein